MTKLLLLLFMVCQLLTLSTPVSWAETKVPPQPTTSIYVQDYAKVLSANTKATINAYSAALDAKTKSQVVVVTIPSLEGASLEDYSLTLLRDWGIGDKEKNNGVLLLVAVNDRKARIDVGYGLEGALPDGLTGRIQDQYMLPYFKQGDYDKGILQGYSALMNTVLKEYQLTAKDLPLQNPGRAANTSSENSGINFYFIIGAVILFLLDQFFLGGALTRLLLYSFFFRGGGGGGGGFGGGGGSFGGGSGGGGGSSRSW